mmetsp:Transcript_23431/g.65597  ORF Transcript_23431/g.65597 Transcript_23431/m.65597 type:complete len:203 (-) Transcript_23431:446-1054(-)
MQLLAPRQVPRGGPGLEAAGRGGLPPLPPRAHRRVPALRRRRAPLPPVRVLPPVAGPPAPLHGPGLALAGHGLRGPREVRPPGQRRAGGAGVATLCPWQAERVAVPRYQPAGAPACAAGAVLQRRSHGQAGCKQPGTQVRTVAGQAGQLLRGRRPDTPAHGGRHHREDPSPIHGDCRLSQAAHRGPLVQGCKPPRQRLHGHG